MDNYILGILYGDGYFQKKGNLESYFFSITHKEIADKVEEFLKTNNYNYSRYSREYNNDKMKNWEILEIIESYDEKFKNLLKTKGVNSMDPSVRIKNNKDFIRGYLETKGSLFGYLSRGNHVWRYSVSGNFEDVKEVKGILNNIGVETATIYQRKERENLGVVSNSYRFNINKRDSIYTLVNYIYSDSNDDISDYLKNKIDEFKHFYLTKPFKMKKVFKHFKYATLTMGRHLGYELGGIKGGNSKGSGKKPIYRWENNEIVEEFNGWEGAYEEVSKRFENELGIEAPEVSK